MAGLALITGASGLLGRHVLRHWTSPLQPRPVDRATHDLLVPGTLTSLVEKEKPDLVLHLAWVASGTPGYREAAVNDAWVAATLEAHQTCTAIGAHFIGTGTGLDTTRAMDRYGHAKQVVRSSLAAAIDSGQITWLRPFYVFDVERGRPEVVAAALHARASAREVPLRTPHSSHDFVHVSDVGRAISLVIERQLTGPVDIGSGVRRKVHELVEALGVSWRPDEPDGPHAPQASHAHAAADTSVLRAEGWYPMDTEEFFHQ